MTEIYEFLKSWGPQQLETMRGCPIKNYVTLVNNLKAWHTRISEIPSELITKGKLLLLNCHNIKTDIGEYCSLDHHSFYLPYQYGPHWVWNSPGIFDIDCSLQFKNLLKT